MIVNVSTTWLIDGPVPQVINQPAMWIPVVTVILILLLVLCLGVLLVFFKTRPQNRWLRKEGMPGPTKSTLTAKIVEWNDQKGFGFLQTGKAKVFLHRRDFAERHKKPEVGDVISFTIGRDVKGRSCATNAIHVNDGGRISVLVLIVLGCLLVLPVYALQRHGPALIWGGGLVLVMSLFSYWSDVVDKRSAKEKTWRSSETGLHVIELLGGWPGAFLAQRRLRHKCSKESYQIVFWLIVIGYQFAALDSLQNWHSSLQAWDLAKQLNDQH